VTKPNRSVHLCCDYRYLNKCTVPNSMPLPVLMDCVYKVSKVNFCHSLLCQIRVLAVVNKTREQVEVCFCDTSWGMAVEENAVWAKKNASGTFVRLMRFLFHAIRDFSETYINDLCTFSSCFLTYI